MPHLLVVEKTYFQMKKMHSKIFIVQQLSDHCIRFLVSFTLKCEQLLFKRCIGSGLFCLFVLVWFLLLLFWDFFLRKIGEPCCVNSDFSLLSHVFHSSNLTVVFLICGSVYISAPQVYLLSRSADIRKGVMKCLHCQVFFLLLIFTICG